MEKFRERDIHYTQECTKDHEVQTMLQELEDDTLVAQVEAEHWLDEQFGTEN